MKKRDFLSLRDLSLSEHRQLFVRAAELKKLRAQRIPVHSLDGRTLVCIFEKASTRTRLSFEAGMGQLGGQAITLPVAAMERAILLKVYATRSNSYPALISIRPDKSPRPIRWSPSSKSSKGRRILLTMERPSTPNRIPIPTPMTKTRVPI